MTKTNTPEQITIDRQDYARPDLVKGIDFSDSWFEELGPEDYRIEKMAKKATESIVIKSIEADDRLAAAGQKFAVAVEEIAEGNPDKIAEMKADDAAERLGLIDSPNSEIDLPPVIEIGSRPVQTHASSPVHASRHLESA